MRCPPRRNAWTSPRRRCAPSDVAALIDAVEASVHLQLAGFMTVGLNSPVEADVRAHLRGHLANFKIPKQIYFKDELPKNATGKVLKRVLKEQFQR